MGDIFYKLSHYSSQKLVSAVIGFHHWPKVLLLMEAPFSVAADGLYSHVVYCIRLSSLPWDLSLILAGLDLLSWGESALAF